MKPFYLYVSSQYQNQYNTKYPKEVVINNLDDLISAANYDHVSAKLKNNHRSNDDYISDNVIMGDCDNTHSNDPDDWKSPDDIAEAFPDVQFYSVYSRSHMKPKEKDGVFQEPRPKFHSYFPTSCMIDDPVKASELRKYMICLFPYFDIKCLDVAHFMFGARDTSGEVYEGTKFIDEYIAQVQEQEPELFYQRLEEGYNKIADGKTKESLIPLFDFLGKPMKTDSNIENNDNSETDNKGSFEKSADFVAQKCSEWGIDFKRIRNSIFQIDCPWKENHTSGDDKAKIIIQPSGSIGFKCHHAHCNNKHWRDLRLLYEPDAYDGLKNFHTFTKDGAAKDTIDVEIVDYILRKNNIFILAGIPYLYENGVFEKDETGNKVRQLIKPCIYRRLQTAQRINRIYNLLLMETSITRSIEQINLYPDHWVPFNNGMWDAKAQKLIPHSAQYYCINKIPHDYQPEYIVPEDSVQVKMFETKIPDPDDREMALEFFGYAKTKDTHLQMFGILKNEGGTGKSAVIRNDIYAVGEKNTSSLSMSMLNQRFYPTELFGKFLNACADISSENMRQVDVLKKATGEDKIMGEIKGGAVFFFTNYAKLIFSANSVPLSSDDYTNAYYRRLLILTIERGEYIPELETRLQADIQSYLHLCMDALHRLYERNGNILISANCRRMVEELYKTADSVHAFIEDRCFKTNSQSGIDRKKLYEAYKDYCDDMQRTSIAAHSFYINLNEKGYSSRKRDGIRLILGLGITDGKFHSISDDSDIPDSLPFD